MMLLWILARPLKCYRVWRRWGVPPWQFYRDVVEVQELAKKLRAKVDDSST